VYLHESWVEYRVFGCDDADTARGLLHNDGQDHARVDAGGGGDGLDGGLHVGEFGVGVVWHAPLRAGGFHVGGVGGEPGIASQ